ncbi:hypothetical protein [Massilia sp. H6]|uniref:hypothetical protein n=1 Tax=Massilia sp. H6 TaxID=2970464 RepID=UPI00216A574F|nr:hypothetical protein [Massilia sp. H6]UVW29304.1 hypothetical protein NRS07_03910 [Massilia sp. H6]
MSADGSARQGADAVALQSWIASVPVGEGRLLKVRQRVARLSKSSDHFTMDRSFLSRVRGHVNAHGPQVGHVFALLRRINDARSTLRKNRRFASVSAIPTATSITVNQSLRDTVVF